MTQFNGRTKICYGPKAVGTLERLAASQAFIVCDQLMQTLGFTSRVRSALEKAGIPSQIFDEVEPDPSLETVRKGTLTLMKGGADLIVALGGGSAIDAAKAMKYFVMKAQPDRRRPRLVVIPTTSGTGSEVTAFSVITDTERQLKIPLNDEQMIPDMAVLDARFTRTVPPSVTAVTGLDVLTHAVEAFTCKGANEFTDIYSLHAIKYVFRYLLRTFRNGDDMEARDRMLMASCMAGMAFNNAGLGVTHSTAHALGGIFHIPHGMANAVMLPYVIRFNQFDAGERYRDIAKELELPAATVEQGTESLVEAVCWLNAQLGIPERIRELKIDAVTFAEKLDLMAGHALEDACTAGNPRTPSLWDIKRLFKEAY